MASDSTGIVVAAKHRGMKKIRSYKVLHICRSGFFSFRDARTYNNNQVVKLFSNI